MLGNNLINSHYSCFLACHYFFRFWLHGSSDTCLLLQHLLNEVANNCLKIATDRSGCCVLQKCLKHYMGALKERLVAGIIANAFLLAEDRYGYVLK